MQTTFVTCTCLKVSQWPTTDVFEDLGVLRSSHHHYSERVASLPASCRRCAGIIQRVFRLRDADLLWTASVAYFKPKVMYASPARSPIFHYKIAFLESMQRHFTKYLLGLIHLTYVQRMASLKALSLEDARMMADMVFMSKMLHNMCENKLEGVGLSLSAGNKRSGKQRLLPISCQKSAKWHFVQKQFASTMKQPAVTCLHCTVSKAA